MSTNQTKWLPCGNKILIQMDRVEEVTSGGIVIPRQKTERDEMSQMIGTVIAVGPDAWADQSHTWAKPGDRVKFAKYAGFLHEEGDTKYRVMHDLDIVMVFPQETQDE